MDIGKWLTRFKLTIVDTPPLNSLVDLGFSLSAGLWLTGSSSFRTLAKILFCRHLWMRKALHLIYYLHSITTTPHCLWGKNPLWRKELGAAEVGKGSVAPGTPPRTFKGHQRLTALPLEIPATSWRNTQLLKERLILLCEETYGFKNSQVGFLCYGNKIK